MKDLIENVVIFISLLISTRADEVMYAQVGQRVTLKPSLNSQGQYLYWLSGKENDKQLAWRNPLGGSGLGEHVAKDQYTLSGDQLIINNVTEENFGTYICDLTKNGLSNIIKYQLLRLRVNGKPQSPLLRGDKLLMSCNAEALPGQTEPVIYWVNPQNKIIANNPNMVNVEATTEHHGQWTCVVKNANKEHNATVYVTVVGLSPAPSHPLYTSKSSPLTIPCSILSRVSWEQIRAKGIQEVYWEFSHQESSGVISGSGERLFSLSLEGRLTWNEDTPKGLKPAVDLQKGNLSLNKKQGGEINRGDYKCIMKFKNDVTLISTVHVEVLNITASPGTVLSAGQQLNLTCSLGHHLPSDLQLKWTAPEQSFHLSSKSDLQGPHLNIPEVSTGDSGKWVCALWQNGTKLTSDVIMLKIEPRLNAWMLVTICSAAVIVILILIVVFILYWRRQRKMRHPRHRLCRCQNPKSKGFYKT